MLKQWLIVQLGLFLPMYFDCLLAYRGWTHNHFQGVGVKLSPSYFFLDWKLLFTDMKLGTHTK